jgi:hypothetical protein
VVLLRLRISVCLFVFFLLLRRLIFAFVRCAGMMDFDSFFSEAVLHAIAILLAFFYKAILVAVLNVCFLFRFRVLGVLQ